jgi:hypothetical protein
MIEKWILEYWKVDTHVAPPYNRGMFHICRIDFIVIEMRAVLTGLAGLNDARTNISLFSV